MHEFVPIWSGVGWGERLQSVGQPALSLIVVGGSSAVGPVGGRGCGLFEVGGFIGGGAG